MEFTEDVQALPTFHNNSVAAPQHLNKTRRSMVLTVNGKAAVVVQDAAAYQRLLDIAAQADALEGIRQCREDVANGRTHDARTALTAFRRDRGLAR